MALKQDIVLPNGFAGDYLRIDWFDFNRRGRTLCAHIVLFQHAARAAAYPDYPLAVVSLLELTGDAFEKYLGRAALAAAGGDIIGQLYKAAKVEPLRPVNGIELSALASAEDV